MSERISTLKNEARGRWQEILSSLLGWHPDILSGKHCPCPKCGGRDRFRFANWDDDGGCHCNQCFPSNNGDGLAAISWASGVTLAEACDRVARFLGVKLSGRPRKRKGPSDSLTFIAWNETLVGRWADLKGVTIDAIRQVGARCAMYAGRGVIAFPILGQELHGGEPVGWVMAAFSGQSLPKFNRSGEVVGTAKMKVTAGSNRPGLVAAKSFKSSRIVWKVEGVSDLLALLSILPEGHSAATNAFGAKEDPSKAPGSLKQFEGKAVFVIHDLDQDGQQGATWVRDNKGRERPGWSPAIAAYATDCRNVKLPGDIVESGGRDLRDYLREGRSFDDLLRLAQAAEPVDAIGQLSEAPQAADDPRRLAAANLDRYAQHVGLKPGQVAIRFWRSQWYKWQGDRYVAIDDGEFRAKVHGAVSDELDRAWHEEQQSDEPPQFVRTVTSNLLTSTIRALEARCCVSGSVEPDTWIEGDLRERRGYVAMSNGILRVDELLAGKADVLIPHSPDWFSTICLPYAFEPGAECPKWMAFLRWAMRGDQDLIDVLQEWCGYCLTPSTDQQKFLVLHGEGGNGKTVFCAGLEAIIGRSNCSFVKLEDFSERFAKTQTLGKLVNISGEAGAIDPRAEGTIKAFTSGEPCYFDRKGLPPLETTPTARLVVACNQLPRWTDKSDAPWRRMLVIPWLATIDPKRRVLGMDKSSWWRESGELPGMLCWAIAGLARLRQHGWTTARASDKAIEDYRTENNPARAFLRERICQGSKDNWIAKSSLYRSYRNFCESGGYRPASVRAFGKEVARLFEVGTGKRTIDGKRENVHTGITERSEFEELEFSGEQLAAW